MVVTIAPHRAHSKPFRHGELRAGMAHQGGI